MNTHNLRNSFVSLKGYKPYNSEPKNAIVKQIIFLRNMNKVHVLRSESKWKKKKCNNCMYCVYQITNALHLHHSISVIRIIFLHFLQSILICHSYLTTLVSWTHESVTWFFDPFESLIRSFKHMIKSNPVKLCRFFVLCSNRFFKFAQAFVYLFLLYNSLNMYLIFI